MAKQGEIIIEQQKFLQMIDRRERETNIIISGLNENSSLDGATDDSQKCMKIMQVIKAETNIPFTTKRLGRSEDFWT